MKIIECPRDAMQGLPHFIATEDKVNYIQSLLSVGFDTIDFGSFVSPKAIPQMRDTTEVLEQLQLTESKSKLLAIIANVRGAEDACQFPEIACLGFPLSLSETFQQRNTKKSITEALRVVEQIQALCQQHKKTLVVYLSMGFGNPYGDAYSPEDVYSFTQTLDKLGISIVSLADTVGAAEPSLIKAIFEAIIPAFPHIEIGAHFHATPNTALEKMETAYQAGCRRIDTAMGGMGGCPMAKDDLTGNLATEVAIAFLETHNLLPNRFDRTQFEQARTLKVQLFG